MEPPGDLTTLGAAAAASLIAARRLTASDLAEALLARIAAREPEIQAWAFIDPAAVRREARRQGR
jgi:Asp-tRNA(Asn)/Glu-tRNA(Gln) amidotransferase A subunit family amidase